jgi:hypothetical protein
VITACAPAIRGDESVPGETTVLKAERIDSAD